METLKKIGAWVLALFVSLFFWGMFSTPYEATDESTKVTQDNMKISAGKKEFVEGCAEEGASAALCTCAFNKMIDMYGVDFVTNEDRWKRILSEGYNSRETDAIVECNDEPSNGV